MKKSEGPLGISGDPEKIALRMNHVVTGAGAAALLAYSIVEYFIIPSLWGVFFIFRIGAALLGSGLLAFSLLKKKRGQAFFYAFWVPVFLLSSLAAGRLPSETSLLLWNIHSCFVILFIASVAVSPPRFSWVLPAVSIISYLVRFLIRPGVPFDRMLINGGVLYAAGLLTMFPLMLVRYRLLSGNASLQRRIADQNEELSALNRAKDRFFSIIAHDLKGPIGSSARVLNRIIEDDSGNKKEELGAAAEAVNRSYAMLENLLLWARSQRDELIIIPVEVNVNRLFEQVWREFRGDGEEKKLVLVNNIDPRHTMVTDKKTTVVIVRNLLSNAVRYSREGGRITVASEQRGDKIVFDVRDCGEGMDEATMDRLFKIEERQNSLSSAGKRGTGLGLILGQELAAKNGGAVSVVSVPGQGSSFSLELPSA